MRLGIKEDIPYSREKIEFIYYLMATEAGIEMMPSELIDDKHFATLRFDRQNGLKKHVLTACGIRGWDFEDPQVSSYENLFELCLYLELEQQDLDQLFRRMVFNLVSGNQDDHLKNHSFIYNEENNKWQIAPAYDITFSLNPLLNFTQTSRVLSINGKRRNITRDDIKILADKFTISRVDTVIESVHSAMQRWRGLSRQYDISEKVSKAVEKSFLFVR